MPKLPDPDKVETGEWIDAYLSHHRQIGWSSRQLHIEAQRLGRAAAFQWNAPDEATHKAVDRFALWLKTRTSLP
jgi:hypothetical protein